MSDIFFYLYDVNVLNSKWPEPKFGTFIVCENTHFIKKANTGHLESLWTDLFLGEKVSFPIPRNFGPDFIHLLPLQM